MPVTPTTATQFEYRGWIVLIEVTGAGAEFTGHADLQRNGRFVSKVTLTTPRDDASSAIWALDSKSRDFIDEWTMERRAARHTAGERPHRAE